MALRNAFEEISTESTLRKILSAVSYAKDSADQLRVTVVNSSFGALVYPMNNGSIGANGNTQVPFGPSSAFSVDEREQQRIQSEQQFNQIRTQRWNFS